MSAPLNPKSLMQRSNSRAAASGSLIGKVAKPTNDWDIVQYSLPIDRWLFDIIQWLSDQLNLKETHFHKIRLEFERLDYS